MRPVWSGFDVHVRLWIACKSRLIKSKRHSSSTATKPPQPSTIKTDQNHQTHYRFPQQSFSRQWPLREALNVAQRTRWVIFHRFLFPFWFSYQNREGIWGPSSKVSGDWSRTSGDFEHRDDQTMDDANAFELNRSNRPHRFQVRPVVKNDADEHDEDTFPADDVDYRNKRRSSR